MRIRQAIYLTKTHIHVSKYWQHGSSRSCCILHLSNSILKFITEAGSSNHALQVHHDQYFKKKWPKPQHAPETGKSRVDLEIISVLEC